MANPGKVEYCVVLQERPITELDEKYREEIGKITSRAHEAMVLGSFGLNAIESESILSMELWDKEKDKKFHDFVVSVSQCLPSREGILTGYNVTEEFEQLEKVEAVTSC